MDNRIIGTLINIRDTYGEGVFYNHTMVKNLLNDLAPHNIKERIQIGNFLEINGFFQLKYAEKSFHIIRRRLIKTYVETFSVEETMAAWVVDLFAAVLGYNEKKTGATYSKTPEPVSIKPKNIIPIPLTVPVKNIVTYTVPMDMQTSYEYANRIAADTHSVMVTKDGKVLTAGPNDFGQCNTFWWQDIISVAAGSHFTLGLKKDGTVLATGRNDHGQCNVKNLSDIKQISAGALHMAALRKDGSVTAVGDNVSGECNVEKWRHIVYVKAGFRCTFGIKKDGRVLVSGHDPNGDLQASHLQNVADIAHPMHGRAIALLKKGTITRIGRDDTMHKNFSQWKSLRQISAAPDYFAGLFTNGTVRLLAYFWPDTGIECATNDWRDIVAIAAGRYHILGLRKDGRMEAAMLHPNAAHNRGQCDVSKWEV